DQTDPFQCTTSVRPWPVAELNWSPTAQTSVGLNALTPWRTSVPVSAGRMVTDQDVPSKWKPIARPRESSPTVQTSLALSALIARSTPVVRLGGDTVCQLRPSQWAISGLPLLKPPCLINPTAQAFPGAMSATAKNSSSKKSASGLE